MHLWAEGILSGHVGLSWKGCNRDANERKGGGVRVLFPLDKHWKRVRPTSKEHLWLTGIPVGQKTVVAIAYMRTGRAAMNYNKVVWRCLQEDIPRLQVEHEILLIGDFNAHLDSIDGYTYDTDIDLLEVVDKFNLVSRNLQQKCEGVTT